MSRYTSIEGLAADQAGRVSWAQLRWLGLTESKILTRIARGTLIRVLPGVYAVGHLAPSRLASLWEAILYAGPGAMLSHATAAHRHGLINFPPRDIHVSTPRKIASRPGIKVHARRRVSRVILDGLPVTDLPQTVLDLAATRPDLLAHALGQLDYRYELSPEQLLKTAGAGKLGSRALVQAIAAYDPAWALMKSPAEVDFYAFCVDWKVTPLPTPNHNVTPEIEVDGYWHDEALAAEVDGKGNHHSDAQTRRDHERDLTCRTLGIAVVRYSPSQFRTDPQAVYTDLTNELTRRGRPARDRAA